MARYFYILIIVFFGTFLSTPLSAPAFAQSKTEASFIKEGFDTAMNWVTENELEAPAASRVYALTAITLYDAWHLSQVQDGYILELTDIKTPFPKSLIEETISVLFKCLDAEASPSSYEKLQVVDSPSKTLVSHILERLPHLVKTPSENALPEKHSVHPEWRRRTPLELSSAQAFRPKGPPPEESAEFQKDLLEVKRLGEDVSELRLADQSLSAAFWGNPAGTITPPGHWNDIALNMISEDSIDRQLDILLALNIAIYDAGIAAWDSKYHLLYPRPHELIRQLDPENPSWSAMGEVPLHPEYVSGHSAFSGAGSGVLISFLGDRPFCNTSKAMWDLESCFSSFTAAAEEAGQSRIFGGLHYQFSNQDGLELGRKVAKNTLRRLQEKGMLKSQTLTE